MLFDEIFIDESKKYVARVKTVNEDSRHINEEKGVLVAKTSDESLDALIVCPVYRKNRFEKKKELIGFAEVVSKRIVADYVPMPHFSIIAGYCVKVNTICDHKDGYRVGYPSKMRDVLEKVSERSPLYKAGDLFWDINFDFDINNIMSSEEIDSYFKQSSADINMRLNRCRKAASKYKKPESLEQLVKC